MTNTKQISIKNKRFMAKKNASIQTKKGLAETLRKDFKMYKSLYLLALPGIIYFIVYKYIPMYGVTIAFKDYSLYKGIIASPWVGFKHFTNFFNSYYFWRLIRNNLMINFWELVVGFPAPIILALLLNEVKHTRFKKVIQTISYLPHFISGMIICGMIIQFVSTDGLIVNILVFFGMDRINLLSKPEYFRAIYVGSGIWQGIGWGTIIYLAALSDVDQNLYDAAEIDGAGRFRQALSITLPTIAPTITILMILKIAGMMSAGFEKAYLLQNDVILETADLLETFVFRVGLEDGNYSYATSVSFFKTIVNVCFLITANAFSRKVNETSLW